MVIRCKQCDKRFKTETWSTGKKWVCEGETLLLHELNTGHTVFAEKGDRLLKLGDELKWSKESHR